MREAIVRQFGKPEGLAGTLVGFVMRVRPSNVERNRRTVDLLGIAPTDRVLEIGFGPGLALERAAQLAAQGRVVGLDHSALMLRTASRRNAAAIAAGRMELQVGSAERLPSALGQFDKVFAVNVHLFWRDPLEVLRGLYGVLAPAGTLALTFQPRQRGATNEDTERAAEQLRGLLEQAGFTEPQVHILKLSPVNAATVLGKRPG